MPDKDAFLEGYFKSFSIRKADREITFMPLTYGRARIGIGKPGSTALDDIW